MLFTLVCIKCLSVCPQVECKKAQPKEVMFPPGTRGRARSLPYTMDAFMLGMGMLSESHTHTHTGALRVGSGAGLKVRTSDWLLDLSQTCVCERVGLVHLRCSGILQT